MTIYVSFIFFWPINKIFKRVDCQGSALQTERNEN